MTAAVRSSKMVWFTLGGVLAGFLLVHPFAMLAYILGPQHPHEPWDFSLSGYQVRVSFSADMLAMALAFALMGGVAGFLLGAWHLQKERLALARVESERRLAALETLRELMVTLAHYIRNANLVIGGFSARLQKGLPDHQWQQSLEMIHQASHEIDTVIKSLEDLSEVSVVPYIDGSQARMIDLKQELEARLAAKAGKKQHES
jgi:signal transduction histidine kinase